MNIICDKTLLSAAIDGVSKAVTLRSTIPVLEGILLKAEGFQLTLTGYDLEMGIVTTIDANVKEPGEVVLNAKLLSNMVSRMPSGQINIQSAENGKTTIQSGVAQFEIQSMNPTDFPELPNTGAEETLNIKTGVLRDMIERTLYAVSQDEKKPAHTGELFEISPDKLTVVALDGYRLAIVERPVEAIKEIRIIVPSKTMNEVSHLLANDDEETVHISANRRYVVFTTAGYTIMSRLIEGEFLNYHNVIPNGSDSPVESYNPFLGMYCAVTRMDEHGQPKGGWYPQEAMTREEALRSYTVWGAYAGFEEHLKGSIEAGKRADIMAIDLSAPHLVPHLDTAGLAVYSAQAADVCMTMVDGRVLYENGEYLTLDRERILYNARAAAKRLYGV